jgi:hypothetical protein
VLSVPREYAKMFFRQCEAASHKEEQRWPCVLLRKSVVKQASIICCQTVVNSDMLLTEKAAVVAEDAMMR